MIKRLKLYQVLLMVYIKELKILKHLSMVLLLLFFSCTQAEEFSAGKHYEVLQTSGKTEQFQIVVAPR